MAEGVGAYNIGQLIASLGLNDAEFQAGLKSAQAGMARMDAQMKSTSAALNASMIKMGKSMQKVGRNMTKFVTLPIIGAGVAAFSLQKDFEKSMSKSEGLVGVARSQVQAWSKDILKLGPALGRSPKELADAMFFITSSGIKGAEAIEVLTMAAKGSVAGLGETKVVADLVTSAMNAYGKENLNAAQATDILVAAVREGKAEATDLAGSMGKVLPIAAEMSVSFDQVGAAIAAMTRTGTTADIAATQLKAILSSLLAPAKQSADALIDMGLGASKLRKMIREDGLIAALEHLRKTTNEYGEEALAKVLPNIRALMGTLDLMGKNAEDNIAIFEALTKATGSLDKAYLAAAMTTQNKWDKAMASLQTTFTRLGITLKGTFIPIIEGFTDKIAKLGEWWGKLNEAQQQNIIKMAGLIAVAGPLLSIFGKLFSLVGMNPYVKIAIAIGAVVAGLIALRKISQEVITTAQLLGDVQAKINNNYIEQKQKIEKLIWIAKNEKISLDRRKEAVEELNRIMPAYNGFL